MEEIIRKKACTYEDYLRYPKGERIQLIDGHIYAMTSAPSRLHQDAAGYIYRKIGNFIEENNGKCRIYTAPFDVMFIEDGEIEEKNRNTVQPDVSVICDDSKLHEKGCKGAPDFIAEVVSPAYASVDYVKKLYLYERFKVKEYWIINPDTKSLLVYTLNEEGQYVEPKKYSFDDEVRVGIFEGLAIKMNNIF